MLIESDQTTQPLLMNTNKFIIVSRNVRGRDFNINHYHKLHGFVLLDSSKSAVVVLFVPGSLFSSPLV